MKLKISKLELERDEDGPYFRLAMVALLTDEGKYVKFIKLDDKIRKALLGKIVDVEFDDIFEIKKVEGKTSPAGAMAVYLEKRMPFGKHKGKTIKEIIDTDAQYIKWALGETHKEGIRMRPMIRWEHEDSSDEKYYLSKLNPQ